MTGTRRLRLLTAVAALAGLQLAAAAHAEFPATRPDVLYIMTDDYGWPFYGFMDEIADLSGWANRAKHPQLRVPTIDGVSLTPGLDRLARRGLTFARGHSADSVCVPSFRSSQSGLHQKDHGLLNNTNRFIGDYVEELGYDAFAFGKSWLGFTELGFSCAAGCSTDWTAGREQITDVLDFISASRPADQPWFAFYSPRLPHAPHDARKWVDSACQECTGVDACPLGTDFATSYTVMLLPDTHFDHSQLCAQLGDLQVRMSSIACFTEVDCTETPTVTVPPGCPWTADELCGNGLTDDFEHLRINGAKYEQYYGNVMLADFWAGLILDFLNTPPGPGQDPVGQNTLILYQTDNGYIPGARMNGSEQASSWKKSNRENGFRTPILASLPSVLTSGEGSPMAAARVPDKLIHAVDLLPTILDFGSGKAVPVCPVGTTPDLPAWDPTLAGGQGDWKAADGSGQPCLEGRSLREYLEEALTPTDRPLSFNLKNGKTFVVTHDGFRVFRKNCSKYFLYDLDADPDEETDKHSYVAGGNTLRSNAMCANRLAYLKTMLECWNPIGCATGGNCATPPADCIP